MRSNYTAFFRVLTTTLAVVLLASQAADAGGLFGIKWDPVKDLTGKNANQILRDRGGNLVRQVPKFLANPVKYVAELPGSVLMDICSAPAQYFGGTLAGQADGRWKALPPQLIAALQSQYNGVNLSEVRYAENIRTGFSEGMTFGSRIYFPSSINLTNRDDLFWMLHELEHTGQYARSNNNATTLCEYTAKSIGSGFNHDRIDMEQAANRKAAYLIDYAYEVMNPQQASSEEEADSSTAPAGNQILVSNDTDQVIYFSLQTASQPYTGFSLPAHTQNVYTADRSETWFNVAITTNGQTIQRGVDGGTVQGIEVNQNGLFDVFQQ